MSNQVTRRDVNTGIGAALLSPALAAAPAFAQGGEPIKIGFSMAQTGSLAGAGQQALLGTQIWGEETNAKGGPLGPPVKPIHFDGPTRPRKWARHLTKAARRGQVCPRHWPVWDEHGGPSHSRRHAKGQDVHRSVRARCER